jgi:hypothetical protein
LRQPLRRRDIGPMIRDEQGIVADIAIQVVGKLSGQLQQGPHRTYAEITCGFSAQASLAFCAATRETFFAFSDLCHEQRVPDRQSHKLRGSKLQPHISAMIRTPPTQPQPSVPQHKSTAKTSLCASLVITKYTTLVWDSCGRDWKT